MSFKRLLLSFILLTSFISVSAEEVSILAPSAIVLDKNTGAVLYEKNPDEQMYPASLTKIVTAVLAIEHGDLDEVITVSGSAIDSFDRDGSNMGLLIGEQITLRDLLYGLIINSAGDAANVIAEHIGGDVGSFSAMMNSRVAQMGAVNTHFTNPHGMHDDLHYTTARDMALISAQALENPLFAEVVAISRYTLPPTNKYTEERILASPNLLINKYQPKYYFAGATGIKTGYTSKAGYCLAASAKIGGAEVVSVVMNDKMENGEIMTFTDTKKLFSYIGQNYKARLLAETNALIAQAPIARAKGTRVAALAVEGDVSALLPADADLSSIRREEILDVNIKAPVSKGERLGSISFWRGDNKVAEAQLVSMEDYEREPLWFIESSLRFIGRVVAMIWMYALMGALIIIGVVYLSADRKNQGRRRKRSKTRVRHIKM